jgi:hypothetical protein
LFGAEASSAQWGHVVAEILDPCGAAVLPAVTFVHGGEGGHHVAYGGDFCHADGQATVSRRGGAGGDLMYLLEGSAAAATE